MAGALLIENAVAQFLRLAHFGGGLRQPHLERAERPRLRDGRCARAAQACNPP